MIVTKSFKDPIQNYYQFLTELSIAIFAGALLVQLITNTDTNWEITSQICTDSIIAIFAISIAVSVVSLLCQIFYKIKEFIKKRRARITGRVYQMTLGPELDGKDQNNDKEGD